MWPSFRDAIVQNNVLRFRTVIAKTQTKSLLIDSLEDNRSISD